MPIDSLFAKKPLFIKESKLAFVGCELSCHGCRSDDSNVVEAWRAREVDGIPQKCIWSSHACSTFLTGRSSHGLTLGTGTFASEDQFRLQSPAMEEMLTESRIWKQRSVDTGAANFLCSCNVCTKVSELLGSPSIISCKRGSAQKRHAETL